MLKKLTNNYKRPIRRKISSTTGDLTFTTMRRETIIPLVIGLLIGSLFVIFFQFNSRLNNNALVISQLEQASASNTKNVTDVINFINSASKGAAGTTGTETPATTPAQ